MIRPNSLFSAAALAILLLAGCGSSGGLGDILGGGSGTGTGNSASEIRGTVDQVDSSGRSLLLTNVSNYDSRLSNSGGNSVRVYYDDRTTVEFQGRSYRPEDLERGDEVAVRLNQSGNRLMADSMTVLRNAGGGSSTGGNYGSNLRGTVRYVDSSRRTIELDRGGYGQASIVEYDNSTYVSYGGQRYRPEDLERGDEIEIRTRSVGSNRTVAEDITVLRSVSGTGSYGGGSSQAARVSGTVRYVDGNRRTIELDQMNWVSGFRRDTNSSVIQYDTNTVVEFQGQTYPPANLERGDVVEIEVREAGGSNLIAERIILVRDVNSR